jgi:hypothetical protein
LRIGLLRYCATNRLSAASSVLSLSKAQAALSALGGTGFAACAAASAAIRASASLRSGLSENCAVNRLSAASGTHSKIHSRLEYSWRSMSSDTSSYRS